MASRFCSGNTEMKILKGICTGGDGSAVIGRILPCDEVSSLCRGEAVIAIAEGNRPLSRQEGTVGIIRLTCNDSLPDDRCARIILPYLPRGCVGKIALLDTVAGVLFVSPDLSTVTKYATKARGEAHSAAKSLNSFYSSEYGRINLLPYLKDEFNSSGEVGCIWEPSPESYNEEYLFEKYRDAAESAPWLALTVTSKSAEFRAEEIRAAMRSGVYGNISLLFGNIIFERQLTETLDLLCHAYCELELEGREFNGYLPRGLLINTPYLLWLSRELRGLDFLVYDLPTLARLSISEQGEYPAEALSFLCQAVGETAKNRKDLSHRMITEGTLLSAENCKILLSCGITDFYALPEGIRLLSEAIEKIVK